MEKLSTNQIREKWLNYFQKHGHLVVESQSLVPKNDKSLLWVNSGVATLKKYFEGKENPPSPRLVNSQKAIRTNDIENIGFTSRHHTFFEMLGNFSIGDYFKKEAIQFAWDFLLNELHMPKEKLFITVWEEDQETIDLWLATGVNENHIIKNPKDKNFWEIGAGPCGPCTEIFFDRGSKFDPLSKGIYLLENDIDNDRYIEIWNIVFSQFNSDGNGNYKELSRKNIDTGAGLERIASIMQETETNFETDLFWPQIEVVSKFTSYKYDCEAYFKRKMKYEKYTNMAYKVIVDHVRAVVFGIADGVEPSNKDKGYIIRRLIRRAMSYAKRLDIKVPFLTEVAKQTIVTMSHYYPYLTKKESAILETIKGEEDKFQIALTDGIKVLDEMLSQNENFISGANAFKLFDTYGLPIEFTKEYCEDKNATVDADGFELAFEEHQNKSRSARVEEVGMATQNDVWMNLNVKSEFIGYDHLQTKSKIIAMFDLNHQEIKKVIRGHEAYIVLDKTPLYAKGGGQISDTGSIFASTSDLAKISEVFKVANGQHVHRVNVVTGQLSVGYNYDVEVTKDHRARISRNHSATHLLQASLIKLIDSNIEQAGSTVDDKRLRFDFTTDVEIHYEDLNNVEKQINVLIKEAIKSNAEYMTMEAAEEKNAIALFKGKYSDIVRVVNFDNQSIELCGGTHVNSTADIQEFMITSFESKGSNVYRIEAITSSDTIKKYIAEVIGVEHEKLKKTYNEYFDARKTKGVDAKLEALYKKTNDAINNVQPTFVFIKKTQDLTQDFFEQFRNYIKKIEEEQSSSFANELKEQMKSQIKFEFDTSVITEVFSDVPVEILKKLIDELRNEIPSLLLCVATTYENKTTVLTALTNDLLTKYNANNILKNIVATAGGRGGGKDSFAQGVIEDPSKLFEMFKHIGGILA